MHGPKELAEVLYDEPTGRLALVFELMDMNAYEMIRGRRHYLTEPKVKGMMSARGRSMVTDRTAVTELSFHSEIPRRTVSAGGARS